MKRTATDIHAHRGAVFGFAAFVILVLGATGCSLTPSMPVPESEQNLPERYAEPTVQVGAADTLLPVVARDTSSYEVTRWWTDLGDSTLTVLIDSVIARNLTVASARARLEELQAQYQVARRPLFPSVNLSGLANRQSQPANTGIGGELRGGSGNNEGQSGSGPGDGGQIPDRFSFTTYSTTLGLSYELDFWGRVRSQKNAALDQFFASAADLQNARIAVISQTISTYYQAAVLAEQIRLTEENIELLQDRYELTRERYERGMATSFELYSIRQQLDQLRAEQPSLRSQLYDLRTQLSVLTGELVGQREASISLSFPDSVGYEPIPPGMPADLIRQRPDVMAARSRMQAALHQIGVARASMLPSVSLTGEVGLQSADLENLFNLDQWLSSMIASLSAPLFQGGALWADVEASKARYRQQVASYEQTLLTAYQEVRAALVAYRQQGERLERIQGQLAAARSSLETQRNRYQSGLGTYVALLDAQQNLIQVQQRYLSGQQAVIQARLAVHRAVGGSWTTVPPFEDPRIFQ